MGDKILFEVRRGYGKEGRAVKVRTNLFRITSQPEGDITHYDIIISPEVPPRLNRRIFAEFQNLNANTTLRGGIRPVFDGRRNMFSPRPLQDIPNDGQYYNFDVNLAEDYSAATTREPPRTFNIKIKMVQIINMYDLLEYMRGKYNSIPPTAETALMALNCVVRHDPAMKHIATDRSFFTPAEKSLLFGGLEVWRGYFQAVKPGQGSLYLNLDISTATFYESIPLLQYAAKVLGRRSPDDLRRGISQSDYGRLEKAIKGLKFRVTHRGEAVARRKFRALGITPLPADRQTFRSEQTGETIVATYFQNTYGKKLQFPSLPCVVVKNNVYIPLEVSHIIEDQRYQRKLNDRQTSDMIKFTCLNPTMRANKILGGFNILRYRENEYLRQFGMRVNEQMEVVPARFLPTPTIQYHASSAQPNLQPKDGSWNLRGLKVATGSTLGSWSVVVFGSERDYPVPRIENFIRELASTCQDTGMKIPNVKPPISHANPQGDIEGSLKQSWLRAGNFAKAQPQLILCVLPNTGTDLYAEIKRVSDTVIGVVTQCVQGRHTEQPKKQYCANVCLKINVKLGGMNSSLEPSQIPFISEMPTILMGADVTYPPPGSKNRPLIAALCASMDAKASRYAASIRVQSGKSDIISDLSSMVKELLKTFYQTCGRKPERILFYRDGVSEGQFKKVLGDELTAIKDACQSLQAGYDPKVTFVVVQKRHHTRFFATDPRDTDNRTGNCLPGLIVEREITGASEFDFYLQSHAGLQGTCRPAHYRVLYNENNLQADQIQTLSYNLCYLFARCTRSVSLVPPVYYAHLVCSRARYHSRAYWSDTETESTEGGETTFGAVKPELQKVMYFM